jgi:hypothetical protein
MSAVKLRSDGSRATPKPRGRDLIGPALGMSSDGIPGEKRINYTHVQAIETLYDTHPAISAAVSVLKGRLLSGGLTVMRNGKQVELKTEFKTHLNTKWLSFASDCIDSLLKFGYIVIVYEPEDEMKPLSKRARVDSPGASKKARGSGGGGSGGGGGSSGGGGGSKSESGEGPGDDDVVNLVPLVPPSYSYDLAVLAIGRAAYVRKYIVYSRAPNQSTKIDDEARVVIKSHPDGCGNINSAMAVCFDAGSFASALVELAIQAETTNARPRIFSQLRKKDSNQNVDPSALFFDTESRQVQASHDSEENAAQNRSLGQMVQMAAHINKLQTTAQTPNGATGLDINTQSFGGSGQSQGKQSHIPPEVPPAVFSLPKDQEFANASGALPQARGDLEALQRLSIEQISAAFGVPSELIFSGSRFASQTTAQLSLLNSTLAQLSSYVGRALTLAYSDIYGDTGASVELLTSPIAATEEVVALHAAGLVPLPIATSICMNAIGASNEEIEAAVKEAEKMEKEKKECDCENQRLDLQEKKLGIAERKAAGKPNPAKEKNEVDQGRANVEKTRAETKAIGEGSKDGKDDKDGKDEKSKSKSKDKDSAKK